jgi:hypothetical protein
VANRLTTEKSNLWLLGRAINLWLLGIIIIIIIIIKLLTWHFWASL